MAIHTVLLVKRKLLLRPDVLPFVALYVYLTFFNPVQEEIYANLMLIAVALLNCIAYLMNFWSARANSFIEFSKLDLNESNFKRATHIRVCSQKKGRRDVYSISVLEKDAKGNAFFHFHNKKYYWSSENKTFERIKPKLDHELSYYREFQKPTEKDIEHFDKNRCDIPLPAFNKLLKDQLIEPFSFFQFFSVGLWLLDENRFYSLFTMFLIFMTSCTVVIQRMRTMFMLKKMVLAPQHIYTFQANKWVKISSEDLKPGDLCMIQPSDSIKILEGSQNDESFASLLPFANLLPKKIQQLPQTQESTDNHKVLPCDFLVLSGNCIVNESILTGESIPQIKDSIQGIKNIEEQFDIKKKHKNNVLYCGTEVIQTFPADNLPENIGKKLPVQGCLGYVLRTGYDTAKGKLTRTVIHNTENLSIKQGEAFILIFILLVISVIASLRVLIPGLEDPDRNKNKLFLRCILIITTVVPPELPMILTMAVNSSLVYLQRKRIFCTEPFRIPLAGKVDTCAFDKTGTLTKDDLIYRGVVDDFQGSSHPIKTELDSLSKEAQFIMAGCHSLVNNGGKLLGDPIEKAIFIHYKWNFSSNDKIASFSGKKAKIIQFHPFQSDLRRMSTLISYFENDVQRGFRAVVKGAPETMQLLYKPSSIPKDYETVYRQYAKKGYRILALGYKKMPEDITISELVREDLESDLEFAGFLLFESILKNDTAKYIQYLQDAAYSITMITGDSELTACSVSRQLKLTPLEDHLLLEENDKNELVWMNEDFETISKATEKKEVAELAKKYTLALNGKALKHIETHFTLQNIKNIVDYTTVFARVSPSQKEYIIETMKSNGRGVVMCGDGTNDVGGLKKADIGLALVGMKDEEEAAKIRREKKEKIKKHQEEMRLQMMQGRMPQRPSPDAFAEMFSDMPEYKPGDASIAAPFTSKHSNSIKCVPLVLRQGVCTLATTFQTYRILSMSCLVSAYTMSALHMQNTKFSETQSTVLGILGAMNYFFYSNTKPLKKLTSIRPPSTIWEPYFICSVISQVCIQLYFMERCVSDIGLKYTTDEDLKLLKEQDFRPTFINSVVFIHSIVSQTCVFLFNYGGQPFMESLSKNKTYLKVLLFTLFVSLLLAANSSDDLNYFLELTFTGVPQSVLYELLMNLAIMAFLNYTVEKLLRFLKYGKFYDIF